MKCLLIDDEPIALSIIGNYLSQMEGFVIGGKCRNAIEAYHLLQRESFDLMFLDIEMPQITGLAFLKTLKSPPKVIITTAYRDFAVEGFELNVVDYLLKPIRFERFLQAIQKVQRPGANDGQNGPPFIFVKSEGRNIKVFLEDIVYIEGLGNYVRIVLVGRRTLVSYLKISELVTLLPPSKFIRIHRSYIVSKEKVTSYSKSEINIGTQCFSVGHTYQKEVANYFTIQI